MLLVLLSYRYLNSWAKIESLECLPQKMLDKRITLKVMFEFLLLYCGVVLINVMIILFLDRALKLSSRIIFIAAISSATLSGLLFIAKAYGSLRRKSQSA